MTNIITSRFALFNDWNFNNVPGLQVYAIDPPGQANRTLNIFALARRNARKLSSAYYQQNTFNIGVYINQPTRALLEQAMDILYSNIQGNEGSLVVPMSGSVRLYTATYSKTAVNNALQGTNAPSGGFADLTLQFELSDSFGYDTNYTLIRNSTGLTSGNVSTQYTQGGTADLQVPFIQAQYTAVGGASNKTVSVKNVVTGDIIAVTRTWGQYDLLQIDLRNKLVQVNGTDADFTGPMMEFGKGLQTINISDNFTSRTLNLLEYVYNRYN